jgi:hypothetical protein
VNNSSALAVQQSHAEGAQYFKDFMQNHKQTCDKFNQFFAKFEIIFKRLKERDKALEKVKHYHEKLKTLKEQNLISQSSLSKDPAKLAKEEQRVTRVSFNHHLLFRMTASTRML